jgi:hypothetical protein
MEFRFRNKCHRCVLRREGGANSREEIPGDRSFISFAKLPFAQSSITNLNANKHYKRYHYLNKSAHHVISLFTSPCASEKWEGKGTRRDFI